MGFRVIYLFIWLKEGYIPISSIYIIILKRKNHILCILIRAEVLKINGINEKYPRNKKYLKNIRFFIFFILFF